VLGSNSNEDKDAAAHRAGTRSWVRIAHGRWDWADQRVPQFNEQRERIEEVTERRNENGRASSVMGRNRFGWGSNMKTSWQSWLNVNYLFESMKQERLRERDRARLFAVCSDLATAMPVARADTYETRDIIGNHRSRATTSFRAWFDDGEGLEDGGTRKTMRSKRWSSSTAWFYGLGLNWTKNELSLARDEKKMISFSQKIFLGLK
jgi:hypothetical protein